VSSMSSKRCQFLIKRSEFRVNVLLTTINKLVNYQVDSTNPSKSLQIQFNQKNSNLSTSTPSSSGRTKSPKLIGFESTKSSIIIYRRSSFYKKKSTVHIIRLTASLDCLF
jgi:hypothetical protein